VPYLQTVSNQANATPHLSTFGFFLRKKPKPEKPKELKFLPKRKRK